MLKAKKNSMNIDVTGVDDMTDRCDLMREVIRRNCDVDPRIIDSLVIKLRRYGDENHMMRNEDLAADALDNAMKDRSPNWERKLYEFLRTNQAKRYLKR